jgi:hypothetical protein
VGLTSGALIVAAIEWTIFQQFFLLAAGVEPITISIHTGGLVMRTAGLVVYDFVKSIKRSV